MLDRTRLEEALDLQQRSYRLLLWLSEAVPRGFVSFNTAHDYASSADATKAWIEEHFDSLPSGGRPATRCELSLSRFSNMFASYLETSFDLLERPGTRLDSRCGCYCPFCAVAVAAPHLQPKRLGSGDKRRARELERACVEQLATNSGLSITAEAIDEILSDRDNRETAAMIAYAIQLVRRCDGLYTGPYVLALWRTFAWTATGSPKNEFRLDVDAIFNAQDLLLEALRKVAV